MISNSEPSGPYGFAQILDDDDRELLADTAQTDERYLAALNSNRKTRRDPHLLVDLRCTQICPERGIPRYLRALLLALVRSRRTIRYTFLVEDGEPPSFAPLLRPFGTFVRADQLSGMPPVSHFLQTGMFDRCRDATVLFPNSLRDHQPALGAILYDLIPGLLPDLYLKDRATALAYARAVRLLAKLDRIFAISERTRRDAVAFGCPPERVITIKGGVDPDRFGSHAASAPLKPTKAYWVCIGGEDPRKNLVNLVRAFGLLHRKMRNPPSLVIVGHLGGPLQRSILANASGLQPPGVSLAGRIDDAALRALVERAVGTIFPSLYEGLGLPVLESYQLGRPALVSDNSSLRDIAPSACRFDPSDPCAIANAVVNFANNPTISQLSLEYGEHVLREHCSETAAQHIADWCEAAVVGPQLQAESAAVCEVEGWGDHQQ